MSAAVRDKTPKTPRAPRVRKPRTRGKAADVAAPVQVGPRATPAWEQTGFLMPQNVVTRADIARLVREFESVDNALTVTMVRKKVGMKDKTVPAMSPQLAGFIEMNPVDLENTGARTTYVKQLRTLKDSAPIVHMTFAVIADPESLQQIVAWLRGSVHPQTILDVHLQPALVAGVYLRTPNHVFDLTVRNKLKEKRGELEKALGAFRG